MSPDSEALLRARDLHRSFSTPGEPVRVLKGIDLDLEARSTVAVTGPSGSGKSTLLSLLAGLDRPDSGEVLYEGQPLSRMGESELARWRSVHIGFVFQNFRLLDSLNAEENAALPLEILGLNAREARDRARAALEALGLAGAFQRFPAELSGGEQQRVAIVRATVHQPKIVFADEPTGSLDRKTASLVFDALLKANEAAGSALLVVTHDSEIAGRMDRQLALSQAGLS